MKSVCWGIVGTGAMAEQFASALLTLPDAILCGVASRTRERSGQFAARFKVKRSFESVGELLAAPEIEIVYISTRNEFHREDSLAALNAGKAVLCEKPFALNAAEGHEIVEAARRRGLFCMEGMWMRFSPAVKELKGIVESGQIGDPGLLSAHFGVSIPFDEEHRAYAKCGGGVLYDLGVYPVSLAQLLFGTPISVCSRARIGLTGVDEQFEAILEYDSGSHAVIGASLRANLSNDARVFGSAGHADLMGGIYFPSACHVELDQSPQPEGSGRRSMAARLSSRLNRWFVRERRPGWKRYAVTEGYAIEADAVQRCLRRGSKECAEMPLNETLEVLETMDVIRRQWT